MFVDVIIEAGDSKSSMASAEFHWHKFQLGILMNAVGAYATYF